MNTEFKTYLDSIGMTNVLIKRVEAIYDFYNNVASVEIADIFVTDFIKEDGSREYESVWFFSPSYAMEAKSFISKDEFDISPIRKRITYWSIVKQDYDFLEATDKSRLQISFSLHEMTTGDLKASKENCNYLKGIFQKYVLPNIID
ncbi:MAG: hypothetical protein ABSA18_10150 [Dehalococcoidia bacterium]|jgi:hypothetical protein